MIDLSGREARLQPQFAHLYPAITAGQWDSASTMADRMVAWLLHQPNARVIATDRILPPEHFEFRGEATRPSSLPDGQSRRGDPR
jgi:hypothetical protein